MKINATNCTLKETMTIKAQMKTKNEDLINVEKLYKSYTIKLAKVA